MPRWAIWLSVVAVLVIAAPFVALTLWARWGDRAEDRDLQRQADAVRVAITASGTVAPLNGEQLFAVMAEAKQSPSVYQLSQGPLHAHQDIVLQFRTYSKAGVVASGNTYACYKYVLTSTPLVRVDMVRLRPEVRDIRACEEVSPSPVDFQSAPQPSGASSPFVSSR